MGNDLLCLAASFASRVNAIDCSCSQSVARIVLVSTRQTKYLTSGEMFRNFHIFDSCSGVLITREDRRCQRALSLDHMIVAAREVGPILWGFPNELVYIICVVVDGNVWNHLSRGWVEQPMQQGLIPVMLFAVKKTMTRDTFGFQSRVAVIEESLMGTKSLKHC